MRLPRLLPAVAALLILAQALPAQIPDTFENLQVLPRDIARPQLTAIMRNFTQALGVRCEYCHVPRPAEPGQPARGGGGLNLNFASDERPEKRKARFMLRMTDSLNRVVLASMPNRRDPAVSVTCITCHRMMPVPTTIENVLVETTARAGVDSAIARYRMLRGDMVSGVFDFSERPVAEVAGQLADQGRHAEAVKLLEMLQEFYPNSVNIDFQIAETQLRAGNRDAGIARLRAVLTKNPNDRRAPARLRALGVEP
ncbi:MAG: c-type cytochrome [Gemmatimonadaceae bacterium]